MHSTKLIAAVAIWACVDVAQAQVLVIPRTAGKSHVVYFDFHWRYVDLTTTPPASRASDLAGGKTGTIRLYFYEREREVASRASTTVLESYNYLVDQFRYVPAETIPLILYSSYQEFLETNLFPLQEGTLGVTSPSNLVMTLPYFGDERLFERIHTHEMSHQFTIQKLRSLSRRQDRFGDPINELPLWFIEGLAEFYALRGIDAEAEMLVRDLVANPDPSHGYGLHDFFDEQPYSVLWIYKGGNVRCAFLEDTYGPNTIQRILEASPRLVRGRDPVRLKGFQGLIKYVTGDDPQVVSAKFDQWIKRRAYRSYLDSALDPSTTMLENFNEDPDSLRTSPDGTLLMMRAFDTQTLRSRLFLIDYRAPDRQVNIATDGNPGLESLHPLSGRSYDISQKSLVFVGESNGRDVIFWQDYSHAAQQVGFPEMKMYEVDRPVSPMDLRRQNLPLQPWRVDISLKGRREFALGKKGLIAAYSPVISPDERQVAFIGLNDQGRRDVYVLTPGGPDGFTLTRITQTPYSEREVAWGRDGIYFTSDATAGRKYNLFRAHPDKPGEVERVTSEARDEFDLQILPDGRVLYVAYDNAHADVFEPISGKTLRRTAVPTGLMSPSPGHDSGLWALLHKSGRKHPAFISQKSLLADEINPDPQDGPPPPTKELALNNDVPYRVTSPKQWELNPIFALAGGGSGGIFGQIVGSATDRLHNHALFLNVAVYGSFNLLDGALLYLNQEQRPIWGAGLFHSLRFRYDRAFQNELGFTFYSYERFFGLLGLLRYPFSRFTYVEANLAVGGSNRFLLSDLAAFLGDPTTNQTGRDLFSEWDQRFGGTRLQSELELRLGYDTLRYGYGYSPITGSSVLLSNGVTVQPTQGNAYGHTRLDASRYFHIGGQAAFLLRSSVATTYGSNLAPEFYLSSFDTLRGVNVYDARFLLGRHYYYANAELILPLNAVIRVFPFSSLEAIAGMDFGGVANSFSSSPGNCPNSLSSSSSAISTVTATSCSFFDRRVLDGVLGANLALGALIFRLHFAKPINVGVRPLPDEGWVTNFSIRLAGFDFANALKGKPFVTTPPTVERVR
jgi:hypothetical protein